MAEVLLDGRKVAFERLPSTALPEAIAQLKRSAVASARSNHGLRKAAEALAWQLHVNRFRADVRADLRKLVAETETRLLGGG